MPPSQGGEASSILVSRSEYAADFKYNQCMVRIHIRSYRPEDLKAVKNLHIIALKALNAYFPDTFDDNDLDHIDDVYLKRGCFLVGEVHGRLIAMGALKRISDIVGEVKRMRVHPDYQRKGYGQLILDELVKEAKSRGFTLMQLDTTSNLTAAQLFYEKNGFTRVNKVVKGWPSDTIFYEKMLV